MSNSVPTPANQADPILAEHAAEIRRLGKRVVGDVIQIGARLTECKRICGHGNWLPWLDREFGWSDQTARNFMRIADLSKSKTVLNLDLPVKALYLLAAPNTPKEATDEIIARAQTGETVSVAETKRIIEDTKREQDEVNGTHAEGAKRKRHNSLEVRLEAFFHAVSFVHSACTTSAEMEIPPLDKKPRDEAVAQLKEASAALSALGSRLRQNGALPPGDDIRANSGSEADRLRARNEELERENTALKREIEELRARLLAPTDHDDGLDIPGFLDRTREAAS